MIENKIRLGYYYHVPLLSCNGQLYLPSYISVFLDALAKEVKELVLFFHEIDEKDDTQSDTKLTGSNIVWINLGKKTPAWHRSAFYGRILKPVVQEASKLDVLLVRSPSPLAPYFAGIPVLQSRLAYLVVGDYGRGVLTLENHSFRDKMVRIYTRWNDRLFKKALRGRVVLVNSHVLYEDLKPLTEQLFEIKTTTLSPADFYRREDTCQGETVNLLYTGRYDMAKGMRELVQAVGELKKAGMSVKLNIAGWEDKLEKPVENSLRLMADKLELTDYVVFHGKKKIGIDLNELYRMADIYVLPSYQEGFPRTIWEALANSCPVIASHVGGIPHYLEHERDALLIEPQSISSIVEAIKWMVRDSDLRRKLIQNGFEIAQTNTLECQTKQLIKILDDHFRH